MAAKLSVRSTLSVILIVLAALAGPPAGAVGAERPAGSASQRAGGGELLADETALYPRAIRLEHSGRANGRILTQHTTFGPGGGLGSIHQSTDDGRTFQRIGTVADPDAAEGLCCNTLFELPKRIGDMPAGTLLWAGSIGQGGGPERRMQIKVWKSSDHGRTWSYLSTVYRSANTTGIWEPEFSVDGYGRLVVHFADETRQPAHSQILSRSVTRDGISWSEPVETITGADPDDRPGMPSVRTLPSGLYVMSYEVCGLGGDNPQDCSVRMRTSPDGWHWGDPKRLDPIERAQDGSYLTATPTIAVVPGSTPHGRILLIGQRVTDADGSVSEDNGSVIFAREAVPSGTWAKIEAPVKVPDAYRHHCPNYSPTMVPLQNGERILEITTDFDGTDCKAYFGTGPTRQGVSPQ